MWPWLIGCAIGLIAVVTSDNKTSTREAECRTEKCRDESEKIVKTLLAAHASHIFRLQQTLLEKANQLLEEKDVQDRKNLLALEERLAKAESQNEISMLNQQIQFYQDEINKNQEQLKNNSESHAS